MKSTVFYRDLGFNETRGLWAGTMRLTTGKNSPSQNWFSRVFFLVLLGKNYCPARFFWSNQEFHNQQETRKKQGKNLEKQPAFCPPFLVKKFPVQQVVFHGCTRTDSLEIIPSIAGFFFRHRYLIYPKKKIKLLVIPTKLCSKMYRKIGIRNSRSYEYKTKLETTSL